MTRSRSGGGPLPRGRFSDDELHAIASHATAAMVTQVGDLDAQAATLGVFVRPLSPKDALTVTASVALLAHSMLASLGGVGPSNDAPADKLPPLPPGYRTAVDSILDEEATRG